jgi:hypothetical protein
MPAAGNGHDCALGRDAGRVQLDHQVGDRLQVGLLGGGERCVDWCPVARDEGRAHLQQPAQPADGLWPVEREAARAVHRRTGLLEQVADQPGRGVRHVEEEVVVGVAATEVLQLDHAVTEGERHRLTHEHGGRGDHDLLPVRERLGAVRDPAGEHRPLVRVEVRRDPLVAVDRRADR